MSDGRAEQLVATGKFREASELLSAKPRLTHFEQVLKAWVEFELEDPRQAYSQAASLLKTAPDAVSQAYCLAIAGRALGRSGSPPQGLALINKAIAVVSKDHSHIEAQLLGIHVNCLLSWVGLEPALVELPRVRRAAAQTGDRRALIEYHIARARIAILQGAQSVAFDEIETAYNLLGTESHSDLHWRLCEAQSITALQAGDVSSARHYADECLRLAREFRSKRRIANTLGNLANIAAISGSFSEAKAFLAECFSLLDSHDPARLAAISTGLSIANATNDSTLRKELIPLGVAASNSGVPKESYYRLWFELHHVQSLMVEAADDAAVELCDAVADDVERLGDRELYSRFRLASAEARYRHKGTRVSKENVTVLSAVSDHASIRVLAEFYRLMGLLSTDRRTVLAHWQRSRRYLLSAGLLGVCRDLDEMLSLASPATDHDASLALLSEESIVAVGATLKLGRHPRLLGAELIAMTAGIECLNSMRLIEQQNDTLRVLASNSKGDPKKLGVDFPRIDLGATNQCSYWLEIDYPSDARSALAWNSIQEIAAAAISRADVRPPSDVGFEWTLDEPSVHFGMLVSGEAAKSLVQTTRKLAPSTITVLITGETGTGKELLARALHDASPRSDKPFIPFNCSAVPRDMLDAQLFGYRRGAFTGAQEAFPGVIRSAAGGTLFLDEIGEAALEVQPKLLRFLESGEIHPLGEPRPIHVDVRVVAATNADLEQAVTDGRFREDLFYRLNVVRLQVPALRERREEIPPLVHFFLERYSREAHKSGIRVADETMEYLILYKWPGNVRQLANEIRRMLALAESGAVLMPEHLSHAIASSRRTIPASERPLAATEVVVRMDQPMSAAMEHVERSLIQYALKLSGGRVEDAADRLGLSRKGLYLKRQRLNIDAPAEERSLAHM